MALLHLLLIPWGLLNGHHLGETLKREPWGVVLAPFPHPLLLFGSILVTVQPPECCDAAAVPMQRV